MRAIARAFQTSRKNKRERYQQLRSALLSDRSTFDAHWREISDFLLPTRTRFTASQRNQGGKRNQNIIDSTARFALRTLQSGLHAGLTSPARPWFQLTTPDPELAKFKPVKNWLYEVTQLMRVVLADSNVYNVLPIVYGDMGGFGTAAMSVLVDDVDLFRVRQYPLGSYAMALDKRGLVTTFVRTYELTVLQLVEEFGVQRGFDEIDWSRLSQTVKNLWDEGNYTAPVEVTWVVQPNVDQDMNRLESRYKKFASCHFETGSDDPRGLFLREAGFDSFPVMAPRWDVTDDDTYGMDCPGMTALGDIKQLQGMAREKGKAIKKMVDPPMVGSPELRSQQTTLLPGGVTYVRDPRNSFMPAQEIALNIDHVRADIQDVRYLIQRAFYEDLFLMLAQSDAPGGQPITAREVEERHEEKLLALGPVLERTNDELLDPVIDRVYLLMEQAGMLPDAPPELQDVELKVEYISIMAQAQKLVGVVGLDRFVQSVFPLIQLDPSLRYKIDGHQLIDDYADALGVDPRIVRPTDQAMALANQEAQAQKGLQDAQAAATMAKATKDASQAKLGQDSALDRLVGGAAPVGGGSQTVQ